MVSRYRDFLDQDSVSKLSAQVSSWKLNEAPQKSGRRSRKTSNNTKTSVNPPKEEDKVKSILKSLTVSHGQKTEKPFEKSIMSVINPKPDPSKPSSHLHRTVSELPENTTVPDNSDNKNIAEKLYESMAPVATLLKDILVDFSDYLSTTLVGSHGQDLISTGLIRVSNSTGTLTPDQVISLVMLLCSQEWQNSIQKNAGLAFIELINDGRILCHNMKDHVIQIAKEAERLVQRDKQEVVKQHAAFQQNAAIEFEAQRTEDGQYDKLITAAKHRDWLAANYAGNRAMHLLYKPEGPENSSFWRLDYWEDDTRRRRRLIRNPHGSTHAEAGKSEFENEHVQYAANAKLLKIKYNMNSSYFEPTEDDDVDFYDTENSTDVLSQQVVQNHRDIPWGTNASLIAPGVSLPGTLTVTNDEIFFDVHENSEAYRKCQKQGILFYIDWLHSKWGFHEIRAIYSRKYLLQNTAVEIFLANRNSVMFNFESNEEHGEEKAVKFINLLPPVGIGTGYGLPPTRKVSMATPKQLFRWSNFPNRWQSREVSNFEYIMFLNSISGRTYQDLNQYPIFPWVISDYESKNFDLKNENQYRDLSKPIGALNLQRAAYFQKRFEDWDDPNIPAFHYGTHYSTAGFALGWLVRLEPFTSLFLSLQDGKFDHPDRTFASIAQSWQNCQRESNDVKELIPEFFYLPEMFRNDNKYEFGCQTEGELVNNVVLPDWCDNNPEKFVRINRLALESEIVSANLNKWIDLIFGFKQKGEAAVQACNVYFHLTYEGAVDLDEIEDDVDKKAIQEQIKHFGQTPSQVITEPHWNGFIENLC